MNMFKQIVGYSLMSIGICGMLYWFLGPLGLLLGMFLSGLIILDHNDDT